MALPTRVGTVKSPIPGARHGGAPAKLTLMPTSSQGLMFLWLQELPKESRRSPERDKRRWLQPRGREQPPAHPGCTGRRVELSLQTHWERWGKGTERDGLQGEPTGRGACPALLARADLPKNGSSGGLQGEMTPARGYGPFLSQPRSQWGRQPCVVLDTKAGKVHSRGMGWAGREGG